MLIVNNIKKSFDSPNGKLTVLNGISFEVSAGELVVISGESGVGKTTLLLTIGALLVPDDGTVIFDSQNPYQLSNNKRAEFRAKNIGFIFQQFHLMPYLNISENVSLPAIASNVDNEKQLYSRAQTLIDELGLSERKYHLPEQLSVGEKQRVALIRALLCQPKLILADEPTGNLDEDNANIVISKLREFTQQGGIAILATHDGRLAELADKHIALSPK